MCESFGSSFVDGVRDAGVLGGIAHCIDRVKRSSMDTCKDQVDHLRQRRHSLFDFSS